MGLFSSKKKTYVSSVAYSLGNGDADRDDLLKFTVLNAVMQNRPIGESISGTYLRGQGMAMRHMYRYAQNKYTGGLPVGGSIFYDAPDSEAIRVAIAALNPDKTINILSTLVAAADLAWWAERYLAQTYGYDRVLKEFTSPPSGVDVNANVSFDLQGNGTVNILLMNSDGFVTQVHFKPTDFISGEATLHAIYQNIQTFNDGAVITSAPTEEADTESISHSISVDVLVGETQSVDTKTQVTIAGGITTTSVTKITTVTSRPQYFIYKLGEGVYPQFDAWVTAGTPTTPYFPSVPVRIDNVSMLSEAKKDTELYKTSDKMLKKLSVDLEELAKQINENKSIKDIDYAYITFGVNLTATAPESQRYLYRFFEMLRNNTSSSTTAASFAAWSADYNAEVIAGSNLAGGDGGGSLSLVGDGVEPGGGGGGGGGGGTYTGGNPGTNSLHIFVPGAKQADNHDIKLQWQYIKTTQKTGVIFTGARAKDVQISMSPVRQETDLFYMDMVLESSNLYARKQLDENTYEEMEICGLTYENHIYKDKSVLISAFDAFNDADENGFIIPLNQQIVRATSIVEITQLSYSCVHVVFNCYKVVKQKWYQTTWFKILLIVIAIVVTYFSMGADGGQTLTWALANYFAATFVISATLAAILASVATVLIGMVISAILGKVAIAAFGDKWGPIIAAIIAIMVGNYSSTGSVTGFAAGQTASITATQVINTSSSVLTIYGKYAAGQMAGIPAELAKWQEEYDLKMEDLEKRTEELLGTNAGMIDIQGYIDSSNIFSYEPMGVFLDRTLLVGSDVVAITSGMVENFAEVGLSLPTT